MGGNFSKNSSSSPKIQNLKQLDSTVNQFSTWKTTLYECSTDNQVKSYNQGQTFTLKLNSDSTCNSNTNHIKLTFFFREFEKWHESKKNPNAVCSSNSSRTRHYGSRGLSLWAISEDNEFDADQYFVISMKISKTVNGDEQTLFNDDTIFHSQLFIAPREKGLLKRREILVQDEFLTLSYLRRKTANGLEDEMFMYDSKIELQVNFSVKVMYTGNVTGFDDDDRGLGGGSRKFDGASSLLRDLKRLYSSDNNMSDLVLKSKDGMTFKVHKVILAARSSYFRRWIQWNPHAFAKGEAVVVDTVNGKVLMVVLHWMYSGELLEENVGNSLSEMIEAAIKFELADLLKILDKRLRLEHGDCANYIGRRVPKLDNVRKIKRAVLAWFPLLRYRFGHRPVGMVASIINAVYGIYELF